MQTYRETALYSGYGQYLDVDKILVDKKTEFQHIQIFDSKSKYHGRVMTLDGILQVTEFGNLPYHEYIAQAPVFIHGNVKNVLVIGAGDGGVIKQLFRNEGIEKVTMVEIDKEVTDLCCKHMPYVSDGAFFDPRLELLFMDGRVFVEESTEQYDLIIVDSTDPIGPGAVLFKEDFYAKCAELLGSRGILITQNGVPRFQADELTDSIKFMGNLFSHATCYMGDMFDYPGADMALGFASNTDYRTWLQNSSAELSVRIMEAGFAQELDHINADTIQAAFALPNYVRRLL